MKNNKEITIGDRIVAVILFMSFLYFLTKQDYTNVLLCFIAQNIMYISIKT